MSLQRNRSTTLTPDGDTLNTYTETCSDCSYKWNEAVVTAPGEKAPWPVSMADHWSAHHVTGPDGCRSVCTCDDRKVEPSGRAGWWRVVQPEFEWWHLGVKLPDGRVVTGLLRGEKLVQFSGKDASSVAPPGSNIHGGKDG